MKRLLLFIAGAVLCASQALGEPTDEQYRNATVRISVRNSQGQSVMGSGTVIDARDGDALILSCAHVFGHSSNDRQIAVDVLGPQRALLGGRLLIQNAADDVSLITVHAPNVKFEVVPVADVEQDYGTGTPAVGIGCDHGEQPSIHRLKVLGIGTRSGRIYTGGVPAHGRSGGGLTVDGRVVGVCNFADETNGEGIFAGLSAIHRQLKSVGMNWVYEVQCGGGSCGPGGCGNGGMMTGKRPSARPPQDWPSAPSAPSYSGGTKPSSGPSTSTAPPLAPVPAPVPQVAKCEPGPKGDPGERGLQGEKGEPGEGISSELLTELVNAAIAEAAPQIVAGAVDEIKKVPFDAQITSVAGQVEKTKVYLGGKDPDGKPSALKLKLNPITIPVRTVGK